MPTFNPREERASIVEGRRPLCCNVSYADRMHSPFMSAHAKDTLIAYAVSKALLELSDFSSRLCSKLERVDDDCRGWFFAILRWKVYGK